MGGRLNALRNPGRLAQRRRTRRRRILLVWLILLALALGAVVYGLWQRAVRISDIEIAGDESLLPGEPLDPIVRTALEGRHWLLVPRDSIFFFPESAMRRAIVAAHPEIATVSVRRTGFSSISVRVLERTAVGRWCGFSYAPESGDCYFFDPNGFVYAPMPSAPEAATTTASSTPAALPDFDTLNPFALYAPLDGNPSDPSRATIVRAGELPEAFNFARTIAEFGSPVVAVALRDDEVDCWLASGTRVTYVIGREQDAYAALASAKDNLNLADSSIEYVDLRFAGKVYLKRIGSAEIEQ